MTASALALTMTLSLLPLGEFTVLVYALQDDGPIIGVIKYASTSIIGVAQSSTATGSPVTISTAAGPYEVNQIRGTLPKPFDFLAATSGIIGNKGSMLQNQRDFEGDVVHRDCSELACSSNGVEYVDINFHPNPTRRADAD